jgi:hypothetical protein
VCLSASDVVSFRIGMGGVAVGNVCALYGDLLPGCLEGLREMSLVTTCCSALTTRAEQQGHRDGMYV